MSTKYFQSENEKEINIINFTMLEEEAKKDNSSWRLWVY